MPSKTALSIPVAADLQPTGIARNPWRDKIQLMVVS